MPNGKKLLAERFPDAFVLEEDSLWVVGSDLPNSSSVKEHLTKYDANSIVVTRIADYHGFYDPALWQKINFWTSQH